MNSLLEGSRRQSNLPMAFAVLLVIGLVSILLLSACGASDRPATQLAGQELGGRTQVAAMQLVKTEASGHGRDNDKKMQEWLLHAVQHGGWWALICALVASGLGYIFLPASLRQTWLLPIALGGAICGWLIHEFRKARE